MCTSIHCSPARRLELFSQLLEAAVPHVAELKHVDARVFINGFPNRVHQTLFVLSVLAFGLGKGDWSGEGEGKRGRMFGASRPVCLPYIRRQRNGSEVIVDG